MAKCYLASFRPLVETSSGRAAIDRHGMPPFIDGSCRREPDFESRFPSITALCRADRFAPRLAVGDRIAYLAVKRRYRDSTEESRRLVAVLRVRHRFPSHANGGLWYREQHLPLPSNCIVEGNPPKAYNQTNGNPPPEIKVQVIDERNFEPAVRLWDARYRARARKTPVFLVTEAEFLDLWHPPVVRDEDLLRIFGRVPGMQNPPEVPCHQIEALLGLATRHPRD